MSLDHVPAAAATKSREDWIMERCRQLRPYVDEYQRLCEVERLIAMVEQHDEITVGWADISIGLAEDALARA